MFNVGDIVTIRDWDSMVNEFRLDRDGDIRIPHNNEYLYFLSYMRKYCGKQFMVVEAAEDDLYGRYYYLDVEDAGNIFIDEMFVMQDYASSYTEDEFLNMIGGFP